MPRLKSVLSAKNRLIFVAAAVSPMNASTIAVIVAAPMPTVNV